MQSDRAELKFVFSVSVNFANTSAAQRSRDTKLRKSNSLYFMLWFVDYPLDFVQYVFDFEDRFLGSEVSIAKHEH